MDSQPRTVYPSWLFPVVVIIVAVVAAFASVSGTTMYFVAHPQISTVTSSTTDTVSQTQTQVSYSYMTQTQISVTTAISTQPNYNYGYPNYNYQNNCYYPYTNCYPNYGQEQTIQGYLGSSQGASCIYLQSYYQGYQIGSLYALYNLPTSYTTGWVTVVGYTTGNYNGCNGTGFQVLSISS